LNEINYLITIKEFLFAFIVLIQSFDSILSFRDLLARINEVVVIEVERVIVINFSKAIGMEVC
jgi:hypothetical protein